MTKKKIISFFAGVGGIDLGFEQTGDFEVIYANEFDKYAIQTYEENFNLRVDDRSIIDVDEKDIPDADVLLAGFPCQAFSVAGYRRGFEDERGSLFFELLRIIRHKRPKVLFIENVKNMVTHDKGNTFKVIKQSLESYGYNLKWNVLNTKDYGNIPQNRERIYIVGFLSKQSFDQFEFPGKLQLTTKLSDVIDYRKKMDDRYYYSEEKNPTFYNLLENEMIDSNTVYQWRRIYVRANKSGVVPTLTANMGTGGHNVPLIPTEHGIRKLTPRETFNVQGYPSQYILPSYISHGQLYKQAGNSVSVPVIKRIAGEINKAFKEEFELTPEPQKRYILTQTTLFTKNSGQSFYVDSTDDILDIEQEVSEKLLSEKDYLNVINIDKQLEFFQINDTRSEYLYQE